MVNRKLLAFGHVWAANRLGPSVRSVTWGQPIGSGQGRRRVQRRALPSGHEGAGYSNLGKGRVREEQSLLHFWRGSGLLWRSRPG